MTEQNQERRLHPRIEIDGDMSYIESQSGEICAGLLDNLSEGGARIWIDQDLPTASEVVFRVQADSRGDPGMAFKATLLYMLPQQKLSRYGYGCKIEASPDWPAEEARVSLRAVKADA